MKARDRSVERTCLQPPPQPAHLALLGVSGQEAGVSQFMGLPSLT